MSYPVLYPIEGDVLPLEFPSYDGGTGASITMTGLATADVEVFKDGGATTRASDNGYALIDTDGIDVASITGYHGITIDLTDNSDAGFWAVGSWYTVVISSVTIDGQTVNLILGKFRILSATRGMTGTALPDAAADAAGGVPISDAGGNDLDAMNANVATLLTGTPTLKYMGPRGPGVYVDSGAANTNTVTGTDGTIDNPVSTFAAARTIADAIGLTRYYLEGNSDITLAATHVDWEFMGIGSVTDNILNLGSQDVSRSLFLNLCVEGVQGGADRMEAIECALRDPGAGATTLHIFALRCGLVDDIELDTSNNNVFDSCYSLVAGATTPKIIATGAAGTIEIRHYSGGLELSTLSASHNVSIEGMGQVIFTADCNVNANVSIRGLFTITDNTAGMASLTQDAVVNMPKINVECDTAISDAALATAANLAIVDTVVDLILADTNTLRSDDIPGLIAALNDPTAAAIAAAVWDALQASHVTGGSFGEIATEIADIQSRLPAALVSGRMDSSTGAMAAAVLTATAIATNAITAAKMAADSIGASQLAADASTEIANAMLDLANGIETGLTPRQLGRIAFAGLAGILAGAATTLITMRDKADTLNRITATVDADGNRSAVAFNLT